MLDKLTHSPLFVLKIDVDFKDAVPVGAGPIGDRHIYPVKGGNFEGARLRGRILPGGSDWVLWRPDGALLTDVRLPLMTHDGAAISSQHYGIVSGPKEVMARFKAKELVPEHEVYARSTHRFETADPRYLWLNDIIAVGKVQRTSDGPLYHIFSID